MAGESTRYAVARLKVESAFSSTRSDGHVATGERRTASPNSWLDGFPGMADMGESIGTFVVRRFKDSSVAAVFAAYPAPVRSKLMALRELIFVTAAKTEGVGSLEESLRWGQPSYLTSQTKSGSTIRIDAVARQPGDYAVYFHCQTTLVESFRKRFGSTFRYEGSRAILFSASDRLPESELTECIATALTYHLSRSPRRVPIGFLIR